MTQYCLKMNNAFGLAAFFHRPFSSSRGSLLTLAVFIIPVLIGLMATGIYVGVQAYAHGELQKAASTAASVGASNAFKSTGANLPQEDSGRATSQATAAFNAIVANTPALQSFKATLKDVTYDAGQDAVKVEVSGEIPTPFFGLIGIDSIDINSAARSKAVAFQPTEYQTMMFSYNSEKRYYSGTLDIPLADRDGNDLLIRQDLQREYYLYACNQTNCYPLSKGVTGIKGGKVVSGNKIRGSCLVDLGANGVKKATSLKFSHPASFWASDSGGTHYLDSSGTTIHISGVKVFGYSGLCPVTGSCPYPKWFTNFTFY